MVDYGVSLHRLKYSQLCKRLKKPSQFPHSSSLFADGDFFLFKVATEKNYSRSKINSVAVKLIITKCFKQLIKVEMKSG